MSAVTTLFKVDERVRGYSCPDGDAIAFHSDPIGASGRSGPGERNREVSSVSF